MQVNTATMLIPTLVVKSGKDAGKTYRLEDRSTIGRHPNNTISLQDQALSRQHATIEVTEDGVFITDLTSVNGTFVNNRRLTERLLILNSDTIRFGKTEFFYKEA